MAHQHHHIKYILLTLLAAALFGAATPLSKALLPSFSAFQLAGLLYLGAALGTAPAVFRKTGRTLPWRMDKRNLIRLIGAILFGGVLAPLFLLMGLKAASAASVSLWLPLELVATAIFGRMIFRDHLGLLGWIGMVGVVAASLLLGIGEGSAGVAAGLLVAIACLCWGFDNNLTSLIDGISPSQSTFWKGLAAGMVNLSIGLSIQGFNGTALTVAAALGVGVFSYGVSIAFYITAAQNIGTTRGQIFFACSPFFGAALSALFLSESITIIQMIAAVVLIGSFIMVFRDKHEHFHEHEELEHTHSHRHDDGHHEHEHPTEKELAQHSHRHRHRAFEHSHPHLPDLHHRHEHNGSYRE